MTENEKFDIILFEIRGMKTDIQEMKAEMQVMKTDIQEMKAEMQVMKAEIREMQTDIQEIKAEMQVMKTDIESLKQETSNMNRRVDDLDQKVIVLDRRVAGIGLHIENATDRNIQLVAENFIELTKKLNEAIPVADKNLAYEVKVNYLIYEVDKLRSEVAELRSKIA